MVHEFRRANPEWLVYSISGPLGPTAIQICKQSLLSCTAWCLPTCLVPTYLFGAWVVRRADEDIRPYISNSAPIPQLLCRGRCSHRPAITDQPSWLCQSRRCPYSVDNFKFRTGQGPVSPGQEGPATQILPAGRNYPRKQAGVPRKTGVWGADDCERPLREGAHRNQPPAHLWFLSVRAERNKRPPSPLRRNPKTDGFLPKDRVKEKTLQKGESCP